MSGAKLDVIWSPHQDDRFLTFGTELSLYKIEDLKEGKPTANAVKVSKDSCISLLSKNSDHQFMKCIAWYPKPNPDILLAVGLASGKVILTSFGKVGSEVYGLVGKEFVPRHDRQCHSLAWNPVETQWVAEGLEKHRADSAILVWDINTQQSHEYSFTYDRRATASQYDTTMTKPAVEIGHSDTAISLAWFPRDGRSLVSGMNNKLLRIYDLRECSRPQNVASTKSVYGVCVDPFFDYRLASFHENQVSVWDRRNFEKPVFTQQEVRGIASIAWSPTRCNLLSVLPQASSFIKLYDILHATVGSDELDPAVIERIVQPPGHHVVSSFSWHPREENRILTASTSSAISDIKVFERIALQWSPDIHMTWACGRGLIQCNTVSLCREASEDISLVMKRRALRGYGLQENVQKNATLTGDDHRLRGLWNWFGYIQSITPPEENPVPVRSPRGSGGSTPNTPVPNPRSPRVPGVNIVLQQRDTGTRSDLEFLQWQGVEGQNYKAQKRIYCSEERSKALKLCGWSFNRDRDSISEALDRLEGEGQFERAAAIALFNLHMRRAIQALSRGAASGSHGEVNLNVIAMALSGFTDDKNNLWKEMCASLSPKLSHPYLRALFAFLTCESENFEEVLDSNIEVIDKVAFACMYLSDTKVKVYLEKLTNKLIEDGNLDGILLTGITEDGIDLMEHYVDNTSDVQTAAVVLLHGSPLPDFIQSDGNKDMRFDTWVDIYRNLLNTWRLWHQRAELDVYRSGRERSSRPPEQVYVSCTFCGKSVAYSMLASRNRHFAYGATTAHKPKISSCPGCRKPMPRCSLCLVNMGTASGTGKRKTSTDKEADRLSQFSNWFTWCQTCRHGGHSHHMTAWFKEHAECPVTGCVCKCNSLDPISSISSYDERSGAILVP